MATEIPTHVEDNDQVQKKDPLSEAFRFIGGQAEKFFGGVESLVERWPNPWEEVYEKEGIPEDLRSPHFSFGYILEEIMQTGPTKVLDVAMGPGRHAVTMVEKGLEVYGFDLSRKALELAYTELGKRNLSCELTQADMFGGYPYPDNFFHSVVAVQAIYHGFREHMGAAFSEIHRVLMPGGPFGFTVSLDYQRAAKGARGSRVKQLRPITFEEVAPKTFMPLRGREKGLPHFYPGESELEEMAEPYFYDLISYTDHQKKYRIVLCKNNL